MNFLAHLHLSGDDPPVMVGNFMGDFLTRREAERHSPGILRGIELHYKIDAFTDRHPMVLRGVRRLYEHHGKYAPVLIDVFYDHLLAVDWRRYSPEPLPAFAGSAYRILEAHADIMPPLLQQRLPLMIADDWLTGYASLEGVAYTFSRMRRRTSRPDLLNGAVDSLRRDFGALREEFHAFFPEVKEYVQRELNGKDLPK